MNTRILRRLPLGAVLLMCCPIISLLGAQERELGGIDGEWIYVTDQTEGRPIQEHGPPMSSKFALRVEAEFVIYPRSSGDEKISLDGTAIETKKDSGSTSRASGIWKSNALEYTVETLRAENSERVLQIVRRFRPVAEGLEVSVSVNDGPPAIALYQHAEDIALPSAIEATIDDLEWLASSWVQTDGEKSYEERWGPPLGGSMFGISRTVRSERLTSFEYLRIIERDNGLVYIAQPGGKAPTEFVLAELNANQAVFLNPRHDYPQRIVYEKTTDGKLATSIGFANGGRLQSMSYDREKQ